MVMILSQLKLLLWKHWTTISRSKFSTLIEILAPTSLVVVLILLRCAIKIETVNERTFFKPFALNGNGSVPRVVSERCNTIYFAPNNSKTVQLLMDTVRKRFFTSRLNKYKFVGFKSSADIEQSYLKSKPRFANKIADITSPVLGGIIFSNLDERTDQFKETVEYTIRLPSFQRTEYAAFEDRGNFRPSWVNRKTWRIFEFPGPRARKSDTGGYPGYFDEGFLYVQYAVESTVSKMFLNETQQRAFDQTEFKLQRFPAPAYFKDLFLFVFQFWTPLLAQSCYVLSVMSITRQIVQEKSSRLKEYLKILGVSNWVQWTAWFIRNYLCLLITAALIAIGLRIHLPDKPPVLPSTNPLVIFLLFSAYSFALTGFVFFISTLFQSADTAATASAVLWLLQSLTVAEYLEAYSSYSFSSKIIRCILTSNTPISFMSILLSSYEGTGDGVQWTNIWEGAKVNDKFCMGHGILMLFINGVVYFLAAFYTDLAFPGSYGVPLPWYFPFTKWFWTGETRDQDSTSGDGDGHGGGHGNKKMASKKVRLSRHKEYGPEFIEQDPPGLAVGVELRGLAKVFGGKIALRNVDFKIFEGQVTALLGHNGAGKSTLMSILTGLIRPSTGTAVVNSFDIRRNMPAARDSMGFCPQYNVLFDSLTVEEHLTFFCNLKGYDKGQTIQDIDRVLQELELEDKRYAPARILSGGTKRKLCLAIAFSAGAKVVFLDEPTAGMDVWTRRSTWDFVEAQKRDRTIILSTHYMDEAEMLGDRIAIMSAGRLQCCGSSLYLKEKYGGERKLVIEKCGTSVNVDDLITKTSRLMDPAIVSFEVVSPDERELIFSIQPTTTDSDLSKVLKDLDDNLEELQVATYDVRETTIEEVFLRTGTMSIDPVKKQKSLASTQNLHKSFGSLSSLSPVTTSSMAQLHGHGNHNLVHVGISLWAQQMKAMLVKKLILVRRNYITVLLQVLSPMLLLAYGLQISAKMPSGGKDGPLKLEPFEIEVLKDTSVLLNCGATASPICLQLEDYFTHPRFRLEETNAMTTTIMEKAESSLRRTFSRYMLGFELRPAPQELPSSSKQLIRILNGTTMQSMAQNQTHRNVTQILTGFFNNQPFHIPPLALNIMTNSLLKSMGVHHEGNKISLTSHPFPYTPVDELKTPLNLISPSYMTGFLFSVITVLVSASFIYFPIQEKLIGSKHLQQVAGVRLFVYWVASFLVDFFLWILATGGMIVVLLADNGDEIDELEMYLRVIFFVLLYGAAVILMSMFLATIFSNPSKTFARLCAYHCISGCICTSMILVFMTTEMDLMEVGKTLHRVFLIFPSYSLASGVTLMGHHRKLRKNCGVLPLKKLCQLFPDTACCDKLQNSYFAWESLGIGKNVLALSVTCLFFILVLVIKESRTVKKFFEIFKNKILTKWPPCPKNHQNGVGGRNSFELNPATEPIDEDVARENARINHSTFSQLALTDSLVVRGLTKSYGNNFTAVDQLNLGMKRGEIFGLLGTNGAGKSSTLKMLTGDLSVTSGDAYINAYSIKKDVENALARVGYCPQFDACIQQLTGRETLSMFARIKGFKEDRISRLSNQIAHCLLFHQHLDKPISSYSGGNKRKLSLALALIGEPALAILDEPSAGMDAAARRIVWSAISSVRELGTSVLITSHNMEECEAICDRMGVMAKGRFRCLGSPAYLKTRHCQGYSLIARLPYAGVGEIADDEEEIGRDGSLEWEGVLTQFITFLNTKFTGTTVVHCHPGFVHCHIPNETTRLSQVYAAVEEAKKIFKLEACTAGRKNLESIFLELVQ